MFTLSTARTKLTNFFGSRNSQRHIDYDAMRQFIVSVTADLDLLLHELGALTETQSTVVTTIKAKLALISLECSLEENWTTAYHAEKLLLALYSDSRIDIELKRRLDQCKRLNAPFAPFYQENPAENPEAKRNLLVTILGDLQCFTSSRYIKMRYARLAILRVGVMFVIAFFIFLLILSRGHLNFEVESPSKAGGWILMAGYLYAFAAGFFGASFFMIVDLQNKLAQSSQTELRDMWTYKMIALRCLFGVGATTILYFFFQTALLGNGVWPDVALIDFPLTDKVDIAGIKTDTVFSASEFRLPNRDAALLLVWSFLAGYSQKFVPNLFSKTEDDAIK